MVIKYFYAFVFVLFYFYSEKKLGVLKSFSKFTGKHQCRSGFFNKVAGLRRRTLLKKGDSDTDVFLQILRNY